VFVADAENYRIQPFAPDGSPCRPWGRHGRGAGQFLHIRALAAAPDGSVYVADSGYPGPVGLRTEHMSRVRRFSASGRLLKVIALTGSEPGRVSSPAGLDVDKDKNLWVADSGNHRVQCFSPAGKLLRCWGRPGDGWGELRYPTAVAVAEDGSVFVADPQHRRVLKFTAAGEPLAVIDRAPSGVAWLRPGRLAIDGDRLFVGDAVTGTIHEYRL
jgi:DNA-binding beta-propeller fold protein YncE